MNQTTRTLAGPSSHEVEIKKSRFIATALRVDAPEIALEKIAAISLPDATHNCWAYRIGEEYRFSDAGEPGGSAGRPILTAIDGQELDRVLVVVSRYFGGIKLGVGGLVRAYGGTAAQCLNLAPKIELRPRYRVSIEIPFAETNNIHNLLPEFKVHKSGESYIQSGIVLELELEQSRWDDFILRVRDITRGKIKIIALAEINT